MRNERIGENERRVSPSTDGDRVARRNEEEMKKCVNEEGMKKVNEMEYNGTNTGLNPNPAGLYVYRKKQNPENTTPAGVAQALVIMHFYKHAMPPASLLPPKNRGRLLTSVNGKESASLTTGLQPHTMWLKPFSQTNNANRQLLACRTGRKQNAIKQTACPDFSGANNKFTTRLNIEPVHKYSILNTQY